MLLTADSATPQPLRVEVASSHPGLEGLAWLQLAEQLLHILGLLNVGDEWISHRCDVRVQVVLAKLVWEGVHEGSLGAEAGVVDGLVHRKGLQHDRQC